MIQNHDVCFLPLHHMSSLVASRSALVKILLPDLEFSTIAPENALARPEFDAQAQSSPRKLIRRNEEQPLHALWACILGIGESSMYTGHWGKHQRIPSATGYLAAISLCIEMGSTPRAHE